MDGAEALLGAGAGGGGGGGGEVQGGGPPADAGQVLVVPQPGLVLVGFPAGGSWSQLS